MLEYESEANLKILKLKENYSGKYSGFKNPGKLCHTYI
jgi:hypothetical protein